MLLATVDRRILVDRRRILVNLALLNLALLILMANGMTKQP